MRGEQDNEGRPPDCKGGSTGEACITCSDTAIPVTVVALLDGGLALVKETTEEISVAFVTAAVGDTVLVHAGEAIAVVPG